eukprot:6206180-Pleurochrysis_carterae.AAC.1
MPQARRTEHTPRPLAPKKRTDYYQTRGNDETVAKTGTTPSRRTCPARRVRRCSACASPNRPTPQGDCSSNCMPANCNGQERYEAAGATILYRANCPPYLRQPVRISDNPFERRDGS